MPKYYYLFHFKIDFKKNLEDFSPYSYQSHLLLVLTPLSITIFLSPYGLSSYFFKSNFVHITLICFQGFGTPLLAFLLKF